MSIADERAVTVGSPEASEGLAQDLAALVRGDVRFDLYARTLYATDASIYKALPVGVVMPQTRDDVIRVVQYANRRHIPILPRGGGTSLAGQAVNEAIVLDFSRYMNRVIEIDPKRRLARVEPGITLTALNRALEPYGLKFAPDPAAGDRSVVGGAIGNNSSGSHSLVYEKTDAYLESLDVVLASGDTVTFGETPLAKAEAKRREGTEEARLYDVVLGALERHRDEIEKIYPKLKRNVSGYNLSALVRDDSINLSRLMAGSEGTLGIVVEATLRLVPIPKAKGLALLCYPDLDSAMQDVADLVATGASAVEVMDDILLDLAAKTGEFADTVRSLPEGTRAVLLVEYYADDRAQAERLVKELVRSFSGPGARAARAVEALDPAEQARLWKFRKAGLPILLSRTGDKKHVPFIEDTAVPPERLPEFVRSFQSILDRYDTYASFYAHAGPGVLHIRPLINLKDPRDLDVMYAIADQVTDLVLQYGGAVSGEHGDGRARTQWNRKMYGERLWHVFREIKEAFDPGWLLNPGQVVYPDDRPVDLRQSLRIDPDRALTSLPFRPFFSWDNENGMLGMVELCHGCGGCRSMDGGVMCPTFRAAEEEITSTRGRANLLREAIAGSLTPDVLLSEAFHDQVLDLCIGCKGCKRDCPSQVDMAKLKAEIKHYYHQKRGIPVRDQVFAHISFVNRIGSRMAPLSNAVGKLPGARAVLARALGISPERRLPRFHRRTFRAWFKKRGCKVDPERARRKVKFFVDCYTNHNDPDVGKAAIAVLEAAGVYVELAEEACCGRPALSKGILDQARTQAQSVTDMLAPYVREGWDIVGIEPSCMTAIQDEYSDLLADPDPAVCRNTYEIMEYLDLLRLEGLLGDVFEGGGRVSYHGHCHQKASKRELHAARVLEHAGFEVDNMDTGCCGMAGSFGYEAEHFEMSMAIGRILQRKIDEAAGERVVATGASCTAQIEQLTGERPAHPIKLLAESLRERTTAQPSQ